MRKEKKGRGQGMRRKVENRREEEELERKLCNLETTRILLTTTWGGGFLLPCIPT